MDKNARIFEINRACESAFWASEHPGIADPIGALIKYIVDLEERVEVLENERE